MQESTKIILRNCELHERLKICSDRYHRILQDRIIRHADNLGRDQLDTGFIRVRVLYAACIG